MVSNLKRRLEALERHRAKQDAPSGSGQKFQRLFTWWECLITHWDYYAELVVQRPISYEWAQYGEANLKRAPAGTVESDDKLESIFRSLGLLRNVWDKPDNDPEKIAYILGLEVALHSHVSVAYRNVLFFTPPADRINKEWLKARADIIIPGQFCGPNKSLHSMIPETNLTIKDYITHYWLAFEFEADRRRAIVAENRDKYGYVQIHELNQRWLERHEKYWLYRYCKFLNISKESLDDLVEFAGVLTTGASMNL